MAKMTIQEQFDLFRAANPHVHAMYLHFTKELLKAGHKRISPRFVMERIRWEMMMPTVATKGLRVACGRRQAVQDQQQFFVQVRPPVDHTVPEIGTCI